MYVEDSESFKQYFRMDRNTFSALLQEIAPLVEKHNTNYRTAISAAERLSMTLR